MQHRQFLICIEIRFCRRPRRVARRVARSRRIPYVDRLAADLQRGGQGHFAPASGARILGALSPRETDILTLIAEGLSNKEIARSLDIGPETVKSHLKSVFAKLGVERRAQAVSRAQTLGLVTTQ
jgi:LuxR family transcriptional regulator, maltose regulon positive regulatory protein